MIAAAAEVAARLGAAVGRVWVDEQVVDPVGAADYAALHGYPTGVVEEAPPGYGAALTMRAVLRVLHDEALGLPFNRNVHAAQELEWIAPLRLGARLTTRAVVENVRERERAVFFDVRTSTDDFRGPVMRGVATQAVRHG